jgi:Holliday junction resolvase
MQQYQGNEEDEDQLIEDILSNRNKKKINSKKKGNRTELELAKILTKRFKKGFSRSVGSGNRWSQTAYLPKHAQDVFSSDLVVPIDFKFSLEVKGGYDGIDLNSIFSRGNSDLNKFLVQAFRDAKRCNKKPMLAWKRARKPWLVFILKRDLKDYNFTYSLNYNKWVAIALDEFIKLDDSFFFSVDTAENPSDDEGEEQIS